MNENTNKKASLSDKIIITITLIAINIILFKHLYVEKNYILLLLIIFVQFCAHYYTGVLLKGKENTLDMFSYKMGAAGLTLLLEFLLFVAYFSNVSDSGVSVLESVSLLVLFLIVIIHYLCTMGNQSIFYSYFQSWEWKACWKNNDIKRIAGEQQSIIKRALINFVVILGLLSFMGYLFLYKYPLLTLSHLTQIVWFDADKLAEYISNAWVLNVYWYLLLGYGLLFWGMIIYFLVYPKYPSYKFDTVPLANNSTDFSYRRVSIRNILTLSIFTGLAIFYIAFNAPALISVQKPHTYVYGTKILTWLVRILPFYITPFLFAAVVIYKSKLYWWYRILAGSLFLYLIWLFTIYNKYNEQYSFVVVSILKILIPSAIIGTIMLILFCIGIVIVNMLKSKKTTESTIYDELNQKMKPWLGFNSRFVSESFINEKYYDFKELYEKTHPKKKNLFYIEYFFSNILNRNVVSLLEHEKLLWLRVFFNMTDSNIEREKDPAFSKTIWSEKDLKKRKAVIETMPTRNRANFEDPEGDVFTNLEIEEVTNTKPSILLPFYVTGVIYLNVIPYFLIYNVIMLIIFTKFVDVISKMDIALFNILAYGYIGVMILIFMGFLLSIFMNSMAVWMAWKKYYRLQNEGNTDALFFSIFKQRAIYQNINDYSKDENGNTITNNYSRGLYPQFDIKKLDEITQKLSPKYHELYSKKFPLSIEE